MASIWSPDFSNSASITHSSRLLCPKPPWSTSFPRAPPLSPYYPPPTPLAARLPTLPIISASLLGAPTPGRHSGRLAQTIPGCARGGGGPQTCLTGAHQGASKACLARSCHLLSGQTCPLLYTVMGCVWGHQGSCFGECEDRPQEGGGTSLTLERWKITSA